MTIQKYALCKNGSIPQDWKYNEDDQKPRYGRLLFVKNNQVLLMQEHGKPWKLPGCLIGHSVDQGEKLLAWVRDFLGIEIHQFESTLGLYTVGIKRSPQEKFEYRETLVEIPSFWRESEPRRKRLFDTLWQPIDSLMRYTSYAAKDFIEEYQEGRTSGIIHLDFAEAI